MAVMRTPESGSSPSVFVQKFAGTILAVRSLATYTYRPTADIYKHLFAQYDRPGSAGGLQR